MLVICKHEFISNKPAINVEQVFIQGRLNGADIAIRISQIGIINIHSWFRVRQTTGQIIDIWQKQLRPNIVAWGIPQLKGNH